VKKENERREAEIEEENLKKKRREGREEES